MNEIKANAVGKSKSAARVGQKWHLVTNHQNMLYMLAAGMAMSPSGFRGKHYSDPLSVYPGQIPLFRDKIAIPAGALSQATSEHKHLIPCIASFDLNAVSGPVRLLSRGGKTREVSSLGARKAKDEVVLLVRAPLPINLLSSISFRSPDEKQAFESAAKNVSNVDLSPYPIEVAELLFSSSTESAWPILEAQKQFPEGANDGPPAFSQAVGGALAMLYQAANRSELGLAIYRLATDSAAPKDIELVKNEPILAELPNWLNGAQIQGEVPVQIFWGSVQALIDAQNHARTVQPIDVVLEYLENQLIKLRGDKFEGRLDRLIGDMRGCFGLSSATTTELFERHKGALSRSLLMFCLRERCIDLLEFSHPLLTDAEYISASILFGVRDTWLSLPKELRYPDFAFYVERKMSDAEHRKQQTGISFGSQPSHPLSILELFSAPSGRWTKIQSEGALELARRCHWIDCIQTRITLDSGNYPRSFERDGRHLVLPGDVIAEPEVIPERFLSQLKKWPLMSAEIESDLRKRLKKESE